jgi:hypothetical protein
MGARCRHHPLRWWQLIASAGTLVHMVLPMIITMDHLSSKNAQTARNGKGKEGHYCSSVKKVMKGSDGRIDARYPAICIIRGVKQ